MSTGRLAPADERSARNLPALPPDGRTVRGKPRPCARCGRKFQPTIKRRMLCAECYSYASGTAVSPFEP